MNPADLELKIDNLLKVEAKGHIYRSVIDATERILIEKALEGSAGNQISAARILGLNRNTIRSKIKKLNIDTRKFKL